MGNLLVVLCTFSHKKAYAFEEQIWYPKTPFNLDIHNLKLDWVSSEALVGMEWGKRLPNTVPDLIALPFFNLGEQNELRLDKFDIIRLHSTWTFTI